ncbi:MAG TPA: L,D-transpeptidase family protein [Polyangiaceae bacterium]|nr:L,D-transpeptidase family protein [Polyangiaceae bacterium]
MLRWLFVALLVAAPSQKANRIVIKKNAHELALYSGATFIKKYSVAIGPGGPGFKHREGDKVTPVGHYHVIMHQPSQFHQFLRLDYPNAEDRARFASLKTSGELPKEATIGGDIGIHGAPPQPQWKSIHKTVDWTLGCIAVDDAEIDEIGFLVADGTPVEIED